MNVVNNESLASHIRSLCRRLDNEMVYEKSITNFIIVDLGNIHDFLPFADSQPHLFKECNIIAFADHHFNGYGVNPRCRRSIGLHVSGTTSRNAADVSMIWFVARQTVNHKCNFYFLTKDKGFREIENLCCECGSDATFYNDSASFIKAYSECKMQQCDAPFSCH